jgi:hypothetical protein
MRNWVKSIFLNDITEKQKREGYQGFLLIPEIPCMTALNYLHLMCSEVVWQHGHQTVPTILTEIHIILFYYPVISRGQHTNISSYFIYDITNSYRDFTRQAHKNTVNS